MRQTIAALAACVALTVASSQATAKDMNGKIGIGGEAPIAVPGSNTSSSFVGDQAGLTAQYWLGAFGIQAIIAFNRTSQGGDSDASDSVILVMPRILFPVITEGNTIIHLVGGLGIGRQSSSMGDMSQSVTNIAIEGGIRPELWVTKQISLHTQLGLAIVLLGDNDSQVGGTIITFLSNAQLTSSVGATFWW